MAGAVPEQSVRRSRDCPKIASLDIAARNLVAIKFWLSTEQQLDYEGDVKMTTHQQTIAIHMRFCSRVQ